MSYVLAFVVPFVIAVPVGALVSRQMLPPERRPGLRDYAETLHLVRRRP